jgi:hypothetical protein
MQSKFKVNDQIYVKSDYSMKENGTFGISVRDIEYYKKHPLKIELIKTHGSNIKKYFIYKPFENHWWYPEWMVCSDKFEIHKKRMLNAG